MKIRMLALAAAAAAAVLPAMAQADWEPTRWGMSIEEVRRVVPTATTQPIGEAFTISAYGEDKSQAGNAYLYTRTDRDGGTYDIRLSFADSKLRSVEFSLINPTEQVCAMARGNLKKRFGTPVGGGSGEGGRYDTWNRETDLVVFIYRTDPAPRCMILYSPNKQPNTGYQPQDRPMTVATR